MKKIIIAALCAASLAGCASQPPQAQAIAACSAYGALLATAVQLRSAGKLSALDIQRINVAEAQASPACMPGAPLPATAASAAQVATRVAVATAILESIKPTGVPAK